MPPKAKVRSKRVQLLHDGASGRARYEILALYRSRKAAEWIRSAASGLPGVKRVSVNPLIGTFLIEYNVHKLSERKLRRLLSHLVLEGKLAKFKTLPADQPEHARWHTLTLPEVLEQTSTDPILGLTDRQAILSRKHHGANRFLPPPRRTPVAIALHQIQNVPAALLMGAAALSLATGGILEAAFIAGVVLFNTGVGFWMEASTEKTITHLARHNRFKTRILRNGQEIVIPFEDIVVGDLLVLRAGDRIPADGRILTSDHLTVDESILTGESLPVDKCEKSIDHTNWVYRGTFVSGGSASAIALSVGRNTEIGKIQRLMETQVQPETPMQQQLEHLSNQLVLASLLASGGVLAIGLLRGQRFLDLLKTSISLAVAAIPETLPTVATLTLARGVSHLEEAGILVRRLDAVETLASVNTVCFDKTGTLTLNRMEAKQIETLASSFDPQARDRWPRDPAIRQILEVGTLCNETVLAEPAEKLSLGGSSTERALLELARKGGIHPEKFQKKFPRTRTEHRAEGRNYMLTEHTRTAARFAIKGSPEEVLRLCTQYRQGDQVRPMSDDICKRILEQNETMASEQLRVLGFATGHSEKQLVWLGLVGMKDPIRAGVKGLIRSLHAAGIETCMITGDQETTAQAIGKSLGIQRCYGRVSPAKKLEVIRDLQRTGQVVAMIGDGVNDGPALRSADIGIAMAARGTEVASQAADIVLPGDNLSAVIEAVREGRTVHQDIHKAVAYIISQNLSEMVYTFVSVALGNTAPFSSAQFLWVNLVTDIFPEIALAQEPSENDVLTRRPYNRKERILSKQDFEKVLLESGFLAAAPLATQLYPRILNKKCQDTNSLAFLTLTGSSIFYTISARSESLTIFDRQGRAHNKYIGLAMGAGFAAELLSLWIPALRRALYGRGVKGTDLLVSTAISTLPTLAIEASKFVRQRMAA